MYHTCAELFSQLKPKSESPWVTFRKWRMTFYHSSFVRNFTSGHVYGYNDVPNIWDRLNVVKFGPVYVP